MERETITRRRLSDEVADRLERLIHSGEFELGDKLPSERALMERFSVDQR
jgi:DNA-binding FadR family transcriptional regulator